MGFITPATPFLPGILVSLEQFSYKIKKRKSGLYIQLNCEGKKIWQSIGFQNNCWNNIYNLLYQFVLIIILVFCSLVLWCWHNGTRIGSDCTQVQRNFSSLKIMKKLFWRSFPVSTISTVQQSSLSHHNKHQQHSFCLSLVHCGHCGHWPVW